MTNTKPPKIIREGAQENGRNHPVVSDDAAMVSCTSISNTSNGSNNWPQAVRSMDLESMPLELLEEVQQHFYSIVKRRRKDEIPEDSNTPDTKRIKREESWVSSCCASDDIPMSDSSVPNNAFASTTASPFRPEVLRLIARSGYLRSQDLGRLLLLSSKSFVKCLTKSFVYQLIYETRRKDRWSSPSHRDDEWVPRSVVRARGHEFVLKSMEALPVVKKRIVALPQINPKSRLNPQNTVFIISFWILSQKIYSHRLTREEVRRLTKTGHCQLQVQGSLYQVTQMCFQNDQQFSQKLHHIRQKNTAANQSKNSTVPSDNARSAKANISNSSHDSHSSIPTFSPQKKEEDKNTGDNEPLVVAKIHCIRLDTNQTCTLYHSNLPRFEMSRTHSKPDQVHFPVQRALSNTEVGDRLVAQWFHGWPEGIQNFGGLTFSVTLKRNMIHIESIVFGAPGQSEYLRARNGVSSFHIIENLAGWQ